MNILNTRFLGLLVILSLLLVPLLLPSKAFAVNIAVVDVEKLLVDSKAAKSIKKQIDKKREEFLSKVKEAEEKLRKDQEAIEKEREKLSKEELVAKFQEFEKKRIKARGSIQKKKSELDKSYSDAMNLLTKTIFDVCQEIANEDGIDLIITRQNIIVGSKSLDITSKVLEKMDKKLPKIDIK